MLVCMGQAYFERQGFSVPLHANPADVYMDIVAGVLTQSKANAGPRHVHGAMSPPHGMLMHTAAEVPPLSFVSHMLS